jgi:hypothetical protein
MKKKTLLLLGLSLTLAATVATAQQDDATTSADAGATVVTAIGVIANTADLNFGSLVASAGTPGTVEQTAAAAPARTGAGVTLGSAAAVSPATFSVTGEGGATYAITFSPTPMTIIHTNATDRMTLTAFASSGGGGTLDASGAQTLYVGGTLNVAPGQAAGVYTGTFDVTVTYN